MHKTHTFINIPNQKNSIFQKEEQENFTIFSRPNRVKENIVNFEDECWVAKCLTLGLYLIDTLDQGCNVRKVISELYPSFVLQCTVSGR